MIIDQFVIGRRAINEAYKEKNRQLTVAMAAVAFSLSAAAVDAYASSVTDTQEQVMIEDEETIEIDPNTTYLSGTNGWVMEGGIGATT